MPPKKLDTVWKASPHTIAKIKLLQAYLKAWLSILGITRRGEQLLYVDGFSGPGEYTNFPTGSPVAAIQAANSVLATHEAKWIAGNVHCAFIDADPARIGHLEQRIVGLSRNPRIQVYLYAEPFVDGLEKVKHAVSSPFTKGHPVFVFIDPFGATGVPFAAVASVLRNPTAEVLINLDADGIDRIFQAGDAADALKHLTDIFGDESWRAELARGGTQEQRCRRVLELYKLRLRSIAGVKYTFAFEMRSHDASINYYLVFAGRNRLGLEKMKEAMSTVDKTGEYCFSDAEVGQTRMFQTDEEAEIKAFSDKLFGWCKGKTISYNDAWDFALNETGFQKPKRMLKFLENKRAIAAVKTRPGTTRRKGEFNEDVIESITFAREQAPTLF